MEIWGLLPQASIPLAFGRRSKQEAGPRKRGFGCYPSLGGFSLPYRHRAGISCSSQSKSPCCLRGCASVLPLVYLSPPYHLSWSQIYGSLFFSLSLGQSHQHHRTLSDFKVNVILNKEDMARMETEKFVLGSLARGERSNLNKTFLCFQGFPWAFQEAPHFLVHSLKTSKREHVSFPLHMKTAFQFLSDPLKRKQRDIKLWNLPVSMFGASRRFWYLMPKDCKPAPSCRKDVVCGSCVA